MRDITLTPVLIIPIGKVKFDVSENIKIVYLHNGTRCAIVTYDLYEKSAALKALKNKYTLDNERIISYNGDVIGQLVQGDENNFLFKDDKNYYRSIAL